VDYLGYLSCALLIFSFCITCAEVLMRYFLNQPIIWSVQATEYTLAFSTFLAAPWVLKKGAHVSIDVMVKLFNPRRQLIINIAISIFAAVLSLIIAWYGTTTTFDYAQRNMFMVDKAVRLPGAPLICVLPIGFLLLCIQFSKQAYRYLRKYQETPKVEIEPTRVSSLGK
jgi:TRAP-type C4-dicarboxylate transport system permease small subunit